MNIHLPAILMFTRGTRFWHTAIWGYPQVKHPWQRMFPLRDEPRKDHNWQWFSLVSSMKINLEIILERMKHMMCKCMYIYIYVNSQYIYIYIYVCMCIYYIMYVYYIYCMIFWFFTLNYATSELTKRITQDNDSELKGIFSEPFSVGLYTGWGAP